MLNLKVCAPNSLIECFMGPYSYIYITFTSSCHNILTPPSSIPFSSLVVFKRTKFIFQHHKLMNDLLAVPLCRAECVHSTNSSKESDRHAAVNLSILVQNMFSPDNHTNKLQAHGQTLRKTCSVPNKHKSFRSKTWLRTPSLHVGFLF